MKEKKQDQKVEEKGILGTDKNSRNERRDLAVSK